MVRLSDEDGGARTHSNWRIGMPNTPEENDEYEARRQYRRNTRAALCSDCGYESGSTSCYENCGIKGGASPANPADPRP